MRCVDCQWFETAPPAGRESQSCVDLGELAQNESCGNFREKGADYEASDISSIIGALTEESYKAIFGEILAESFTLEQDSRLALLNIKAQLQTQGATVDATGEEYQRTASKLIDLYVTYRLAAAIGLGRFIDDIMAVEIKRRFSPPPRTK